MNSNLTLVGFSFTVVGLLVTLFQANLSQVYEATFLFSLSVACFFASYLLLYLRLKRFVDTMSEGLTNAGLWATIAGLRALFLSFDPLKSISPMFTLVLVVLASYIVVDISLKWRNRRSTD
jgi:drug/metabolite transporter (DMT)-like permease